jgi:predicted amidohydrolase
VETTRFVVSPCATGSVPGGGECFGHSLIVDPWGEVLADGGEGPGVTLVDMDLNDVRAARRRIPALRHDRSFAAP